jgi:hypothetical protein
MENDDPYVSLRKSLDSFCDVALTEFDLLKSEQAKKEFSEFVRAKVKEFLAALAKSQQDEWNALDEVRAAQFRAHADSLLAKQAPGCPPGFHEVDGICVRV